MINSFLVYCNSRSPLHDTPHHLKTLLTRNDSTRDRTLNIADSWAAVYCQQSSVEDKYPKTSPSPSILWSNTKHWAQLGAWLDPLGSYLSVQALQHYEFLEELSIFSRSRTCPAAEDSLRDAFQGLSGLLMRRGWDLAVLDFKSLMLFQRLCLSKTHIPELCIWRWVCKRW